MQNLRTSQPPDSGRTHCSAMEEQQAANNSLRMDYTCDFIDPTSDFFYPQVLQDKMYDTLGMHYNSQQDQSPHVFQQIPSIEETLEPHMMLHHHLPLLDDDSTSYSPYASTSSIYGYEAGVHGAADSSFTTTSVPDVYSTPDLRYSPASSDEILSTPGSKCTDEDTDNTLDKPYARLIYEALMQAPNHRMMLRDIYEWFIHNTNKPRESGSNGWQNSIRHNLSMNQAFENDRSDVSSRGHPRKANSVWILTEHAVKHGVQSTTRYRKSGTAKKASNNRLPATERQKSGSRGGKAARRAALLRREQELSRNTAQYDLSSTLYRADMQSLDPHPNLSGVVVSGDSHQSNSVEPYHYTSAYTGSHVPYSATQPEYPHHQHHQHQHHVFDDDRRLYDYISEPFLGHDSKLSLNSNLIHDMFA